MTDLNLQIETAGVAFVPPADEELPTLERALPLQAAIASSSAPRPADDAPLPADEEQPTALVAPDTLQRELEKSRQAAGPVAADEIETLMASSLHMGRHELPTAPAPFPVIKLDALVAAPVAAAPVAAAPVAAAPVAAAPVVAAPADVPAGPGRTVVIPKSTLDEVLGPRGPKGTAKMAGAPDAVAPRPGPEPLPLPMPAPSKRRGYVALALLVILAAVVGAVVSVYLLDGPRP